ASRFTNAFKQLYAQGYNNVISIGNDSPDLNLGHVTSAIKKLEQGNMILGPSSDGGAYLIGMHRSQFNAATFKALPWQQETLFSEMAAEAYSKNLSVFYLNILDDIDATEDLFGYVKKNPYTLLAVFAKEFLSEGSSSFGQFLIGPALQKCYSSSALRAPPFQLAA
ncbi:MAG TPA: DUF2064 domain-containing protein, partial [Leeuwenhoekiella sp.]|nr:DUF2064 domain-containing protein [Leeuwenhoekiella sp.]